MKFTTSLAAVLVAMLLASHAFATPEQDYAQAAKAKAEQRAKMEQEYRAKAEQKAQAAKEQQAKAEQERQAAKEQQAKMEQEYRAKAEQKAQAAREQQAKAEQERQAAKEQKAKAEQEYRAKAEQKAQAAKEQQAKSEKERPAAKELKKDTATVKSDRKELAKANTTGDAASVEQAQKKLAADQSTRRQDEVNARLAHQEKRIENGVARGSLTPDEVSGLQAREAATKTLEEQLAGDGNLSRDDARQLNQELNQTSLAIWAEKRNTDGVQQPVYRLGKDVTLNDATAKALAATDLSKAEARGFVHDFGQLAKLKRVLASQDLTSDQRAAAQSQYNDLLSQYFVVNTSGTVAK